MAMVKQSKEPKGKRHVNSVVHGLKKVVEAYEQLRKADPEAVTAPITFELKQNGEKCPFAEKLPDGRWRSASMDSTMPLFHLKDARAGKTGLILVGDIESTNGLTMHENAEIKATFFDKNLRLRENRTGKGIGHNVRLDVASMIERGILAIKEDSHSCMALFEKCKDQAVTAISQYSLELAASMEEAAQPAAKPSASLIDSYDEAGGW